MIAVAPGPAGPKPESVPVAYERCEHATWQLRKRTQSNGVVVVVRQCDLCGANMGAVPKASHDLTKMATFDEEKPKRYWAEREARFKQSRQEDSERWWTWYNAYLLSPQWRAMRERVLARDRGVCQGCLTARATQVHHLTYQRVGRELLIDLTSLCDTCHTVAHPDK